jgi:hypothetical protein
VLRLLLWVVGFEALRFTRGLCLILAGCIELERTLPIQHSWPGLTYLGGDYSAHVLFVGLLHCKEHA